MSLRVTFLAALARADVSERQPVCLYYKSTAPARKAPRLTAPELSAQGTLISSAVRQLLAEPGIAGPGGLHGSMQEAQFLTTLSTQRADSLYDDRQLCTLMDSYREKNVPFSEVLLAFAHVVPRRDLKAPYRVFFLRHRAASVMSSRNTSTVALLDDVHAFASTTPNLAPDMVFPWVHGIVWEAVVQRASKEPAQSMEALGSILYTYVEANICDPKLGWHGDMMACHHGVGHGMMHVATVRTMGLPYTACRSITGSAYSLDFTQAALDAAATLCTSAPTAQKRKMCSTGVHHTFTTIQKPEANSGAAWYDHWSWPCGAVSDRHVAVGCYIELLQPAPFSRAVDRFVISPRRVSATVLDLFTLNFTTACVSPSLPAKTEANRLGCIEAMSSWFYPAFDDAHAAARESGRSVGHACTMGYILPTARRPRTSLNARYAEYAAHAAAATGRTDELPALVVWCHQFVTAQPGVQGLDERDEARWLACITGIAVAAQRHNIEDAHEWRATPAGREATERFASSLCGEVFASPALSLPQQKSSLQACQTIATDHFWPQVHFV